MRLTNADAECCQVDAVEEPKGALQLDDVEGPCRHRHTAQQTHSSHSKSMLSALYTTAMAAGGGLVP